jgi:nucleotide-binding universal stress UspA family protein
MTAAAFRRVLVPVEFETTRDAEIGTDRVVKVGERDWVSLGPCSVQAIELAARLAAGGEVWLVHATPDFLDYAVYGGPEGTWIPTASIDQLNETARKQSVDVLEKIGARHCPGVELRVHVEAGKAVPVILELARQHPPDAIVLAASSRGRVKRALLGSTADKIIRQAFCPVVVVPSGNA